MFGARSGARRIRITTAGAEGKKKAAPCYDHMNITKK